MKHVRSVPNPLVMKAKIIKSFAILVDFLKLVKFNIFLAIQLYFIKFANLVKIK